MASVNFPSTCFSLIFSSKIEKREELSLRFLQNRMKPTSLKLLENIIFFYDIIFELGLLKGKACEGRTIQNTFCYKLYIQHFDNKMKTAWQFQTLTEQDYQLLLYTQLRKIREMNVSNKAKAKMVQGFLCLLREKQQMQKVKAQQNLSTSFSEEQSNFTMYQREIQELEDKILQKRAIKFQMNQEIEGLEQDLFQMQKTVDTKRQYDEQLRKQIEHKMKKIEVLERTEDKPPPGENGSYIDKSFRAVTGIFRGWLY